MTPLFFYQICVEYVKKSVIIRSSIYPKTGNCVINKEVLL